MLPKANGLVDVLSGSAIVNPLRSEESAYNQPMADTNDRVDVPPEDGDDDDPD